MLVVGLTGGIASGKTVVSDAFAQRGVPIIDTDILARELVAPGQPALSEIIALFGAECVDEAGQLKRRYLREKIFAEPLLRQQLEAILHPRIRALTRTRLATLNAVYCIVVIPLLVETGMTDFLDRILVVDIPEAVQLSRVMARDNISETQARHVLAAQASRTERLAFADDLIDNSGDLESLNGQVAVLHQNYLKLANSCCQQSAKND